MDLNKYYRENKDEIHSSLMEIAAELATARLKDAHNQPFEAFIEPENPDDPDDCTCFKEEYQDEYDRYYDEEYNRLALLMKFDYAENDAYVQALSNSEGWNDDKVIKQSETPDKFGYCSLQTPQEQLKSLTDNLIASFCHITKRPDEWLPHIVYVEEEGDYPVYNRYELIDYKTDGSCTLYNPRTDISEDDHHLNEINIDWLITVWNRYVELCTEQGIEQQPKIMSALLK